jgi:hypothetical protein
MKNLSRRTPVYDDAILSGCRFLFTNSIVASINNISILVIPYKVLLRTTHSQTCSYMTFKGNNDK